VFAIQAFPCAEAASGSRQLILCLVSRMNPLSLIERLIEEHGSSAIQGKHLAMLKDEIAILLRKNEELSRENLDLKSTLGRLDQKKPIGDQCPYCNERTGKLAEIKPHPQSLLNQTGTKIGHYQCGNLDCGKSYEKQISMRNA
jgi:hypothetical protein